MLKLSHSFSLSCTFHNRKFAKNTLDAKNLQITLTAKVAGSHETFDLAKLKNIATKLTNLLDKAAIIRVDDPYLIRLIEPKAGNTVHTFLADLSAKLQGHAFAPLGFTIPPETINGYHVVVLGTAYDVTLEGIAEWLLSYDSALTEVTVSDGALHATIDAD